MVTEVDNIVVRSPPDVLEVVGGGDDLGGAGVEVVVGVLGDDGAAAHEVVAVAEDEAGPGELPGRGLSVLQTPHRARVLSDAALLAAEAGVFLAAVPHQPAVVVAEAVAAAGAAELEVAGAGRAGGGGGAGQPGVRVATAAG